MLHLQLLCFLHLVACLFFASLSDILPLCLSLNLTRVAFYAAQSSDAFLRRWNSLQSSLTFVGWWARGLHDIMFSCRTNREIISKCIRWFLWREFFIIARKGKILKITLTFVYHILMKLLAIINYKIITFEHQGRYTSSDKIWSSKKIFKSFNHPISWPSDVKNNTNLRDINVRHRRHNIR